MSYSVNCAACQAVIGACMDCGGCFLKHCECDPCQHGHARAEIDSCAACRPAQRGLTTEERIDALLAGNGDPLTEGPAEPDLREDDGCEDAGGSGADGPEYSPRKG